MSRRARPKRSLGQNFLVDPAIAHTIVDTAQIGPEDHVVEIGGGRGALTALIAARPKASLTVIEKDDELAPRLAETYQDDPTVTIHHGDVLTTDLAALVRPGAVVIGNLPYNVSVPIVFGLFVLTPSIRALVVMLQKEVAIRFEAAPDTSQYGILAVKRAMYAAVDAGFDVGPEHFRPRPKVTSRVIRLTMTPTLEVPSDQRHRFGRFVDRAFGQRRKILVNALGRQGPEHKAAVEALLADVGRPRTTRAQELTPAELYQLYQRVEAEGIRW